MSFINMNPIHLEFQEDWNEWPYGIYFTEIPTMELGRKMFGPTSKKIRQSRSESFYQALGNSKRTKLRLGMHDRGEEYLFADGIIHEEDIAGHNNHMPFHVKVIRVKELRIGGGQRLDFTSTVAYWPKLHHREELYTCVYIDKLIVEEGASVEIHGNIFVFNCKEILFDGADDTSQTEEPAFRINILGTHHAPFSKHRNTHDVNGVTGASGKHGKDNSEARITGSPFGPMSAFEASELMGGDGTSGRNGTSGRDGQNGGMAMLADIRIGDIIGFRAKVIQIFGQAKSGYPGGTGGDGGDGGHGGHGAKGKLDHVNHIEGGVGGTGGDGGDGGDGGRGGNGGLASNIFVTTLERNKKYLLLESKDSLGGLGGKGGKGGKAGLNGISNSFQENNSIPLSGKNGKDGSPGRGRNKAEFIVEFLTN